MKELTKAEEQVLLYLWELRRAFVWDIVQEFPEPKPAYTTVSTIVRKLEDKGLVGHKVYGRTYEYFPTVSKRGYARLCLRRLLFKHFKGSPQDLFSSLATDQGVTLSELVAIKHIIESEIKTREGEKEQ